MSGLGYILYWSYIYCPNVSCVNNLFSIEIIFTLNHCRPETPKPVLWQTVKTQMKCALCGISSGSALFAETKSILRERNTIVFGNYNL